MVSADEVELRGLHQRPDRRRFQVRDLVVVGRSQVGAHGAVLARDDHAAAAGGGVFGGAEVLGAQAGGLARFGEERGVVVVADAADVEDGGRGEDVLGAAGGVLGCAAGDELGVVVLDQVFVQAHVFIFGEDGVVGLEAVVLEHGFIAGWGRATVSGFVVKRVMWARFVGSFNGLPFALNVCFDVILVKCRGRGH